MADTFDSINRRRVYSDGSDGQAATPLPVMAQQNLNTASALPGAQAAATVQPGGAQPAPTLNAANPVQPAVMPVAAPAAAAAAAAPVTPVGGAAQIPAQAGAAPYVPPTPASPAGTPGSPNGAYPNWGGIPVGSQAVADNLNYYGGKALDAVATNAPALMGGAGEGLAGIIQGVRGLSNVARAVPALARESAVARAAVVRPAGAIPNAAQATQGVAPELQAVKSVNTTGAAPGTTTVPATPGTGVATVPPTAPVTPGAPAALPAPGAPVGSNLAVVKPGQPALPAPPVAPGQPQLPGMTVTEGAPKPNMAGTGTPLTAAQQEAQAAAAGQRLGATENLSGVPKGATQPTGYTSTTFGEGAAGAKPPLGMSLKDQWGRLGRAQKSVLVGSPAAAAGITMYAAGQPTDNSGAVHDNNNIWAGTDPSKYAGNVPGAPGGPDAPAGTDPADLPDPTLGQITKYGNSYSGTNVGAGALINGHVGGGGMVGNDVTPEQAAINHQNNLASLNKEYADMRELNQMRVDRDRGWSGVIGTSPGDNAFGVGMSKDDREKFHEDAAMNWATSKKDKAMIEAAKIPIEARQKREAETLRAANELAKTQLTTQAENARAAATNAATMYGHQLTAQTSRENNRATTLASIYGSDSKSASDRAKLDFEAKKSDRDYQATQKKEGTERADKEFDIRNKAQDTIVERAKSMRDPADKAGVAKDAQAVNDYMEGIRAQLEQQVADDPNNKDAKDMLDKYKRYGARNLDDSVVDKIIKGNQLSEKVNKYMQREDPGIFARMYRGLNQGVNSSRPFRGVKKVDRGFGYPDIYVETDEQGRPLDADGKPLAKGSTKYGRVLPASVVETDEGLLGSGLFAKKTDDFRSIRH